jgi:hypothetical protein
MLSLARRLLLLCLLPLLAACAGEGLSAQQDADLRGAYQQMRAGDLAGLEARWDRQFRTPTLHQDLAFMQGMIPPDAPRARVLKALSQPAPGGGLDYGALYEFDYRATAVLAQIEMRQDKAGHKTLTALQLRQDEVGVARSYDFSLTGRKPYQYFFLVLMALAPAFGVWGLIHLWRAPDIKWKVLWALAMCVGFMDLTMDWRTGDVVLTVAAVHPLWIKAARFNPLSPWMLTTSLPAAAIAFLLGYRRLERPWKGPRKD